MADGTARIRLTVEDKAALAALKRVAQEEAATNRALVRDADKRLKEAERANAAIAAAEAKSRASLEKTIGQLAQEVTGLTAAEVKLAAQQGQIEAAFKSGTITAERYQSALGLVAKKREMLAAKSAAPSRFAELTDAVRANTATLSDARGKINQAAEATGKLAAAVSLVSPEAGAATMALQKLQGLASAATTGSELLAGGLGSVGAAAGVLALAVAPLVPLWYEYKSASEAAAAAEQRHAEVLGFQVDLRERVAQAQRKAIAALGGEAEETEKLRQIEERWAAASEEQTQVWRDRIATLEAEIAVRGAAAASYRANKRELDELTAALEDIETITREGIQADKDALEIAALRAEAPANAAKNAADKAKALAKAAQASKAAAKEDEAGARAALAQAEAFARQAQAIREASDPLLKMARLEGELREAVIAGGLATEDATAIRTAAYAEQAAAAEAAHKAEIDGIERELDAALKAWSAREAAAKAAREAERQYAIDSVSAVSDTLDATSDILQLTIDRRTAALEDLQTKLDEGDETLTTREKARLERRIAEQAALLTKSAKQQKAAAVLSASLSGAAAVAGALASPPFPPLNTPVVIATGVAAGAQVAAAASTPIPSYDDTPQVMRAEGGRTTVSFKDGDFFAAAQDRNDLVLQVLRDSLRRPAQRFDPAPSPRVELRIGPRGSRQVVQAGRLGGRGVTRTTSPVGG